MRPQDIFLPVEGMDEEPWVRLADGLELADWSRDDLVRYNQKNRQMAKYQFYIQVFDYLKERNVAGDYLEFGCHRARTFRMALTEARRQLLDTMRFYAFDSFQGLPECDPGVDVNPWVKGALCTTEEEFMAMVRTHGIYTDKIETVPGFYADSLTPARQRSLVDRGCKAALVTLDCDLYSSAREVFGFIGPFLQPGTVIYLDDMFGGHKGSPAQGVHRAFLEFQAGLAQEWPGLRFATFMQVGGFGRAYLAYLDPEAVTAGGIYTV